IERVIDCSAIGGSAKHNQARGARGTLEECGLPEDFAIFVQIESHGESAFCSGNEDVFSIGQRVKNQRRAAEVVVRAQSFRTVVSGIATRSAIVNEGVSFYLLVLPYDFPAVHIKGDHGIRTD